MVEINNRTKEKLNKNFVRNVAKFCLLVERKAKADLSIAFVSGEKIRRLNIKYRKKNKSTDILSFAAGEPLFGKQYLGELIISTKNVKRNAKNLKISFRKELARTIIHGTLHLLGYEHEGSKIKEKEMLERQEKYVLKLLKGKIV